ncbi:MAG: tRNA dihydrouridine synthase DusB [Pseudomonadales bacterium]|nr:tRNA dihydrouridine synthase DusB [Pseudomonadales bacterium]
MAGVTDSGFRKVCRDFGAGLVTTEMLTSQQHLWHTAKSMSRLDFSKDVEPRCVQIAGSEPEMMAAAAREAVRRGAQIIDINMGCPAKKVCKKAAGSALLRDEKLVDNILHKVVSSVDVPVTLKTRTGWSTENRNAASIARIAEDRGIKAMALHGRTRACGYHSEVEYDTIAAVVRSVDIPVIANGDIDSPFKARDVLKYTGASAVMLGRPVLGRPWLFRSVDTFLKTGSLPPGPPLQIRLSTMEKHLREIHLLYGEISGVKIARKHMGWYFDGLESDHFLSTAFARTVKQKFYRLQTANEQYETIAAFSGELLVKVA